MDRGGGSRLNARPDSTHSPTVSPQQIFPPASSGGLRNDPRNVWVARRIKDAIGEAAQNLINVDAFIRTSVVERRLQEFYSASGPPRIIFFLQQAPVTPFGDLDEETELKLIPTDGLDTQLRGKCIYFIRQAPIVDPDTKTPDLDMFYGEVNTDVLESFHLTLSGAFLPLLEGGMQDWGRSTDASTKEYLSAVTRFDEMIADAVSSLQGGIELRKPEKRFIIENKQQAYHRAAQDPEVLAVYENIMEDWCIQCEQVLAESAVAEDVEDESGPDTEFEFWRNRMAKFNSVAEQLKTRGCKCVLGVVGQVASKSKSFKRWKHIDSLITDSLNEARDNVKYLSALERYTEALYSGTPAGVIEALPALIHNMKVMLTISRFYGTNDRMTVLFIKITNQIITKCKDDINLKPGSGSPGVRLWDQNIPSLLERFRVILKVQDVYTSLYAMTKDKLAQNPKGRQFDFNEGLIFGKVHDFSKRVQKLLDMFTTIQQFSALALHNVEGMEILIHRFFDIMIEFKRKPYDLLDFTKSAFDRDYLEYTVHIEELEKQVQTFINLSFENILSTEQALALLKQFETVLVRDSLKSDLDSKYTVIFHNYGLDLEAVQRLYERQKAAPPLLRNAPPVTGNILWAKQLLRRIEEPMRRFKTHSSLMSNSKEAKKIVRTYNKVARALVEFETLWHSAWTKSIEAARSGLQATLLIRHPVTDHLFVNFDREILQLIRETKCLQRVQCEVPDHARMVLVHEDKYKSYYNQLFFALSEYERVVGMVIPLVKALLEPHLKDLEHTIHPGRVLLTWQSMNIDQYLHRMHTGLSKFEDLMKKVNDILDHRIEGNLRTISKTFLVELPSNESFTLEQFVTLQEKTTKMKTSLIESKNEEIENAVADVIDAISTYPLEIAESVSKDAIEAFWEHYSRLVYVSVMRCTKESFFALKKRLASKASGGFLYMERPFFDVDIELSLPLVTMNPSLDEIQAAINRCALNILRCSKHIMQWPHKPPEEGVTRSSRTTFHTVIAQDYKIVAVCLMLTGAVEGIKKQVHDYLHTFMRYDFLWKEDKQMMYDSFVKTPKTIDDFEAEIQRYVEIENVIGQIAPVHNIGSLSLETGPLKQSLRYEASQWKRLYTGKIQEQAKKQLNEFMDYMKDMETKLDLECNNIDDAKQIMKILADIRDKEMDMEMEIRPIIQNYQILLKFEHVVEKEELDTVKNLAASWDKVVKKARDVSNNLFVRQNDFRAELLNNVEDFVVDVKNFRDNFIANGPMEDGITPADASERMRKYKFLYTERERKWRQYADGEALFGMPKTQYMEMDVTRKELELLDKLYTLYTNVMQTIGQYRVRPWGEATLEMNATTEQVNSFQEKARKMPKQLRSWEAYKDLTKDIEDFVAVLPLIQALSSCAMRPRHWQLLQGMSAVEFDNESPLLTLGGILETGLHKKRDEVEALCLSAERELEVEVKLADLEEIWGDTRFEFLNLKNKGPVLLKAKELSVIFDKVEDSTNAIGTMVGHSHCEPFREEVQNWIKKLTSVQEVLEQWTEVQSMWVNMEVVFSNNDIAKQLPQDSKRFAGVDKSYMKLMHKAFEISNVVLCCHGHEPMKTVLPNLAAQLDMCQKSLNGYFESKRLLFPRFFFISDSLLLELLSEGSEPQKIIGSIGMLFDSLVNVVFDENDSHVMTTMISDEGEHVKLSTPLLCDGMAEEYLEKLVVSMRTTIRDISRECAHDLFVFDTGLMEHLFRGFPGQVCLIGLQIYWTNFAEEALLKTKQDKLIMSNTAKKFDADLKELLSLVKKDLGPSQRISLESMITVQMFQKETFDDLVKAKIKDVNDFEWQKQARSIWKSEDHQDSLVIHMMDTSIMYKNEFFGCKERLVMTALTTRCYLTIFQALSMHLGVAHFGPAGTGKTMAIQDLGRTLGKYVVVFNCSNQLGISALGKILKGVAMTGSWGCFDDLSRVDLDAISVAAQQMSTILFAKRAKAKNFVFTDGDNGTLDANAAYFMTLLPSPENTLALPENMKTQVRGIMMLTPDPVTIVRCKLSAAGYLEASKICSKLDTLYDMCSRCLSKQPHYDFGLRNLCSLVMVCGRTKRSIADPDVSESQMVVQALKETNLACLTQEDSIIFIDFLNTLFPGVSGEKLENVKQSGIMRRSCDSLHLEYDSISAIRWVEKLTHFHEICQVRHGVGLVGPTGGGKSTILQTSIQTFGEMEGVVQSVKTLNPKAVDLSQVFGYFDMTKSKWSEGIFSTLWRKAAQTPTCSNWIVFDGPVDLDWMENLNTALDDTKVLTLANGDRLPVPDRFRIVLETDDLVHASPAAVSRIGIIFVSSATLGYEPVVSSWLKSRPEPQRALLEEIFAKSFSTIVNVASRILKTVMDVPSICLVQNMLRYLEALLSRGKGSEKGDQTQPVLERMIVYSFCWSFGGPVENEGRGRLEVELKKVLPTGFPAADLGKPFDCYLDDKSDWKQASKIQLVWEFPIGADFWDIYVPTTHNEQYRMHLELLAPQKIPVLLLGGVGTGKTSMILQFMRDRATNDGLTLKRTVLSADTSPSALQRAIESATEKRQGRIYGPSNYRTCSVLIDDVNMPRLSNWGDQPTSELLRQLISEKGFFNLDKPGEWKIIKDLEYFAAMTHPGGGRHDVPARLKRRMVLMNLTAPPRAALDRIYSEMVRGYFSEKNVGSDTASVASKLAEPTINIWSTLQERITPTATKFHCNFTLHDLSHVFRGMVRCHPDTFDGKDYVARLWKHECERAFTDKLSSLADTVMASALITEALDEALGKLASKCHATSYFCPFMQNEEDRLLADGGIDPDALFQPYEICQSFEEIQRRVQTFLHKYNHDPEIPHKMDLVLFQYAVEYLLKIVRGICFDGGSCLLIGLKASGKQSLATLALYILDHQVLRIRHSRRSSRCTKVTLLEDLNSHCKSAALHDQHFTFLLTEADMIEESFLDLVNQLIFTGEITDMFTKDEMSIMVGEASFRAEVQKHMPEWSESTENLTKFFIRRVRRNFHCIMCFSPSDPKLMTRVRCYPALMGSCHLIWFTVWPAEGLQKVAEHSFLKNKIKMQHKEQILKHIPEVQDLAQATALDYLKEFGQKVHVTPMTYLLFLETYAHVFLQKDAELHLAIRKFKKGLHKLEQVGEDVEEMLADIEQSEQFLQKAQFDSGNLLKDITNQQSVAERKKKVLEEAHVALAAVEAVVLEERNGIQKELVVAEPYLKRAEEGLNSISPKDLQTLKALKNPPAAVKVILDSVLILLKKPLNPIKIAEEKGVQYYKDSYATALGMMNDGTFVDVAQNYPRDSINDESIELLQPYLDNALFNPDVARKASAMAAGLCTWVQSLDQYYTFARIVKPRRNLLFDKEVELAHAQRRYESVESDLNRVRDEIEEMQRNLREAVNEKNSLQSETEITREKVKAANTLIRALAGEKTRWMASAGDYQLRLAALPGDVSVAACFLTYCGPLSKHLRQDLCTNVKADLRVKGLPKYENFDLTELLSTEGERGDWTMQSLPGDHFSIENGILVTKALRWPLLIDPEGQGLEWIYRKEKDNMLKTTTFGDNHFLHIYEECITHGRPMLIENVNDKLDPIVESILKQRYALTAGPEREMSIKIGDKDLDVAAGFALYLMTKLPNPDLSPDMASQVTVINFKISIESLQDQLFVQIVQKERPEFQAQRNFTVGEVHTLRKNTADLDADILTRIYNISEAGSILDDVGLIEVLEKVKEIDRMVKEKEKIVDGLSKKIDQSCTELRSVAKRASALYSVMLDFAHVNTMYKTSLQQFKGIFKDSVMNAPKENNIQLKVQGINTELTWMFFKSIRRGIMEQDKELFALMIGLKIIQFDGSITVPHLQCFIEGGYGLDADQVRPKPYNWLAVDSWLNVMAIFNMFPVLKDLPDSIQHLGDQWRSWYDYPTPELHKLPDIPSAFDKITPFLQLLIVRAMRPDRTMAAALGFIKEVLGENYIGHPACDLEAVYQSSAARTPLIVLLSPGADPTGRILALGRKLKKEVLSVSMGQGQDVVARRHFDTGIQIGSWVLLQNVHLDVKFLYELEQNFYKVESIESDFRMFMTTEVTPAFPVGLLQMSIKMSNEAPTGVKAGLRRLYSLINQDMIEAVPRVEWRSLLFSLSFMHSVMLARRRFVQCGWSTPCDFSHADFICCATFLQRHVREIETKQRKEIHWETLRTMIVQVLYGGDRSDESDLRLMRTLSEKYISPLVLETNFQFALGYPMPGSSSGSADLTSFRASIEAYPAIEKPEILGLSSTSEFVVGLQNAQDVFKKLGNTMTSGDQRGPEKVPEAAVLPRIEELLQKLPYPFGPAEIRESLAKDGGAELPTNVAFKHELDVLNKVINTARNMLQRIHVMLSGLVTQSDELNQAVQDIYFSRVPRSWEDLSWQSPNLGHWIQQLQNRLEQWKRWLERGRPFSFWLAGFVNPTGFLSALKQEVAMKQKGWGLQNCVFFTEVTKFEASDLKGPAENGAYVHGLYLDGASWNRKEAKLIDTPPKIAHTQLPVLYICVLEKSAKKYDFQVYECPCYTRKVRGIQNYVFTAELKTEELVNRWILRGVALICSRE